MFRVSIGVRETKTANPTIIQNVSSVRTCVNASVRFRLQLLADQNEKQRRSHCAAKVRHLADLITVRLVARLLS